MIQLADEPLLNKPKRTRAPNSKPRRNFEKKITEIRTLCEIKIEVLKSLKTETVNQHTEGQIEALEGVLAKIGAQ